MFHYDWSNSSSVQSRSCYMAYASAKDAKFMLGFSQAHGFSFSVFFPIKNQKIIIKFKNKKFVLPAYYNSVFWTAHLPISKESKLVNAIIYNNSMQIGDNKKFPLYYSLEPFNKFASCIVKMSL